LRTQVIAWTLVAATAACTQRLPEPVPVADPGALAERLRVTGTPDQPQLIEFEWRYRGREGRFSGDGAVRVNPPDSVRLDLLGPGWSGVQSAILVGDRVHYIGEQRIQLPPPTFMWTMLGTFRPPADERPEAATRGDWSELTYAVSADETVTFLFDSAGAVVQAELKLDGSVVQTIKVEPGAGEGTGTYRWPKEARYRDLAEFHEVNIKVKAAREHEPFERRIYEPTPR
jgi:hypothetical protein